MRLLINQKQEQISFAIQSEIGEMIYCYYGFVSNLDYRIINEDRDILVKFDTFEFGQQYIHIADFNQVVLEIKDSKRMLNWIGLESLFKNIIESQKEHEAKKKIETQLY